MKSVWVTLIIVGVVFLLGGLAALANPFAASVAVTTLVGIAFFLGGALQAWVAFEGPVFGGRLWHAVTALMGIVAGIWLIANPLQGMLSLTLLLAIVFLIGGAMRIGLGLRMQTPRAKWLVALSGAAGVVIAVLIFTDFGLAATSFLGILLSIELLSQGIALIAIGLIARNG